MRLGGSSRSGGRRGRSGRMRGRSCAEPSRGSGRGWTSRRLSRARHAGRSGARSVGMDAVTSRSVAQARPPLRARGAGGGPPGPQGPAGPAGPAGVAGIGVPLGGSAGQVLAKATGTDYDTIWSTVAVSGGASVHVGPTAPATPVVGDLWWRNDPEIG